MADYLADFGVKDQRREKRTKRIWLTVIGLALAGVLFWYFARTFSEERTAKRFIALLESRDYRAAYGMWGCTDQTPCRDYKFEQFVEDWGPKSPYANASDISITLAEPCGNSVWVTLKTPKTAEIGLSVDPDTKIITYTPPSLQTGNSEARCPGKLRVREFPGRLWRYLHSKS